MQSTLIAISIMPTREVTTEEILRDDSKVTKKKSSHFQKFSASFYRRSRVYEALSGAAGKVSLFHVSRRVIFKTTNKADIRGILSRRAMLKLIPLGEEPAEFEARLRLPLDREAGDAERNERARRSDFDTISIPFEQNRDPTPVYVFLRGFAQLYPSNTRDFLRRFQTSSEYINSIHLER